MLLLSSNKTFKTLNNHRKDEIVYVIVINIITIIVFNNIYLYELNSVKKSH